MRSPILFLFLLVLAVACSSTSTDSENASKDKALEREFDSIKNSDFTKPQEVPYKSSLDSYKVASDKDILSSETREKDEAEGVVVKEGPAVDPTDLLATLCYQKNFDKAFQVMDSAYDRFYNNPSYWNQIGSCYLSKGELRKAIIYYNKARELKKDYVPAQNNLGVIFAIKGDDQKALAAFKEAAKLNPFSLTPLFNQAIIYLKYYQVDKAYSIFKALYERNPDDPELIVAMATCHLFRGEYADAVTYFSRIKKELLVRADLSVNYALTLKFLNRESEARSILSQVKVPLKDREYMDKVARYIGVL